MLGFICSIPENAVKQKTAYKSLFSFYTATLVHFFSLNAKPLSSSAGEDVLRLIYPFLLSGLKSDNEEYKLSTYAILSSLSIATSLEQTFLSALCDQVIVNTLPHTHQQSFVALLVLLQSLDSKQRSLSEKLVSSIMGWSNLVKILTTVADSNEFGADLSAFYAPYLSFLAKHATSSGTYVKHAFSLLVQLPGAHLQKHIPQFGHDLINQYLDNYSKKNEDISEDIRVLLQKIDSLFPRELDIAIDQVLGEKKASSTKSKLGSSESWNSLFEGTRHQLLVDPSQGSSDSFSLAIAFSDGLSQTFTHALTKSSPTSLTVRALTLLKSMPAYANPSPSDPTLPVLKENLLSLLDNSTEAVVLKSLFSVDIHKFIEASEIFQKSIKLLQVIANTGATKEQDEIYSITVSYLSGPFVGHFKDYVDPVLSLLLCSVVRNTENASEWSAGCSQLYAASKGLASLGHPLLKGFVAPSNQKHGEDARRATKEDIVKALVVAMGKNLAEMFDKFYSVIYFLSAESRALSAFLYLVQNHALAISKDTSEKCKLAFLLLSQISRDIVSPDGETAGGIEESDVASTLSQVPGLPQGQRQLFDKLLGGNISLSHIQLHSVGSILALLEGVASDSLYYTSEDLSCSYDFPSISASPFSFSLLCRLLFLVISNSSFRASFNSFFPRIFGVVGTKNLVDFLSYFWSSPPDAEIKFNEEIQVLCLRIFQAMLLAHSKYAFFF